MERLQDKSAELVTVVVEPSAFERGGSDSILGPIRLHHEVDGSAFAAFPEHEWTDFVVVILGWWMEGLRNLHRGAEQVLFRFMDGPLSFRVTSDDPETYGIHCLEERLSGEVGHADWSSPKSHFESSLLTAGLTSLAECERRGWKSRDIDTLRHAIRSVRLRVSI